MSASEWGRIGNKYVAYGHRIKAVVYMDGELWRNHIWVQDEGELERGEWICRETAIRNSNSGMERLCWHRRFDKDPPMVPVDDDDDDTGDPDDDE